MAALPFIVAGIGGITQFVGAAMQGNAAKEAGEYNAKVDEQNSALSAQGAAEDERIFRINTRHDLGAMQAGFASNGISTSEGSALEVLRSSAANAELDALKVRQSGQVRTIAYQNSANQERRYGAQAQTAGALSAVGSLLGTTGSIIGRSNTGTGDYATLNRSPAF